MEILVIIGILTIFIGGLMALDSHNSGNETFGVILFLIGLILVIYCGFKVDERESKTPEGKKYRLELEIQEALRKKNIYREIRVLEDSLKKLKQ